MEMSDMLDVLHFFFEQDARYSSAEEAESVSAMRTSFYRDMYGESYRYAMKSSKSTTGGTSNSLSDPSEVKPYIPPTEFNPDAYTPFGSVLDAPIG